ncbi:HNH endonuclease [Streptomyces tsukubensis]|uniref:HNH endonuclease n=1 Tax=Streptomyces tsukubensis TaxID=83656 RepID=UPI00344EE7BE
MSAPNARRRREIRAELAVRDGARCWYCATEAEPDALTIDHLIPQSRLRTWLLAALVLACAPCNEAKADLLPQLLLRPAPGRFGPGLVAGGAPAA